MKHVWNPAPNYEYYPKDAGAEVKQIDLCSRCGCKRTKRKGMSAYYYSRSKIQYGFDRTPDCIDWEEENSKTID